MATSRYPPTPPRDVERMLTDIARYLVLIEGEDPEDVAKRFEANAHNIRAVGDSWSLPDEDQ